MWWCGGIGGWNSGGVVVFQGRTMKRWWCGGVGGWKGGGVVV